MSNLKHFIDIAPDHSGVYKFLDIHGQVLYVGKAKSLKKRLRSYLQDNLAWHIQEMVFHAVRVEWHLTATEMEALFLEAEWIEKFRTKYNIQHRNGRNYTYILLGHGDFPRLSYTKYWSENTYGPFLSGDHVRTTVDGLYSVFKLRSCTDHVFKNRKKPCMEYDLGRCSAPCVGLISQEDYKQNVLNFHKLFTTTDTDIIDRWNEQLEQSVIDEQYEVAQTLHKRVQSFVILRNSLLEKVDIANADMFISSIVDDVKCIHICHVQNFIMRHKIIVLTAHNESLMDFIARWSIKHDLADDVYVSEKISVGYMDCRGKQVRLKMLTTSIYPKLIDIKKEGEKYLKKEIITSEKYKKFAKILGLKSLNKVEVYDNSHMGGKWNVGVKIVWTPMGFRKSEYEVFKYEHDTHDDYYMMRQLFQRRFCQYNNFSNERETGWPDVVIIDGGVGQLSVSTNYIPVKHYALSKHEEGDKLHVMTQDGSVVMDIEEDLRLWLCKLRDEAHRFAVASHSQLKEASIMSHAI